MARDDAEQRVRIREAILHYVHRYPLAADTAEGILACWLPRAGFEDAPDYITAVLEEMVARRWLRARQLPDGKVLFSTRDNAPDCACDTADPQLHRAEQ